MTELIADPALLEHDELFFNAGRLDRSSYARIARPRIERIAQRAPAAG